MAMDFIAVGGDARFAWMAELARREGLRTAALGLEEAQVGGLTQAGWGDLARARLLVMPNPFGGKGLPMPLAQRPYSIEEVLEGAEPGVPLALFGPGQVPLEVAARHRIWDLSGEEGVALDLARQTAEGAIHAACTRMEEELYGCPALIVGYGRIGRALHRMLEGYGARVTVAARRPQVREQARAVGARAVDMEDMEALLPLQRLIFSTPPQRVLDARRVGLIHKEALVIDLSSPPYGVDLAACHAQWINAWREPGLPGRYCPRSAGRAMLDALARLMRGGNDYAG